MAHVSRPLLGVTAAVVAFATAGCGGGGDERADTTPTPTPSTQPSAGAAPGATATPGATTTPSATPAVPPPPDKASVARRLDAVCASSARRRERLRVRLRAAGSSRRRGEIIARLQPVADREIGQLQRLRPPEGREAAFGRYVNAVAEASRLVGRLAGAEAGSDDEATAAIRSELARIDRRRQAAARELDAGGCAQPRKI